MTKISLKPNKVLRESTDLPDGGRSNHNIVQYGQYALMNVGPWLVKGLCIIVKASGLLPASQSGHATTIIEGFFA